MPWDIGWRTPWKPGGIRLMPSRVLREFADFSGRSIQDITEELMTNAAEAARVAAQFWCG